MTLDYFRVQLQKVAAFASGLHSWLGAASGVSWLDEQALVMIADEVLGGWDLLKEWRQESRWVSTESQSISRTWTSEVCNAFRSFKVSRACP